MLSYNGMRALMLQMCEILSSQDDVEYTSVYSITGWDSAAREGAQDMNFDNVDARYVKALLKNGATPWRPTIKENLRYTNSGNIYNLIIWKK
ncbi:hypothetical protein NXW09_28975 [Bacteroides ovatus]|nr:hypothetical protein [Bacteroides ovatus]